MSDDATPRLSLPYLAAGQAQKHVTLNESLAMLDGLVQTSVESRTTAAQRGSPADGDLYILPASPTGADWSGKPAGTVMRYEAGAWAELAIDEGCTAWVKDEDVPVFFDGSSWVELTSLFDTLQNLAMLGVNATADATNKLSVSSSAVLFSHAGAGSQVKVNKNAAGDTGSHLFQTGFSGRAEFGLIGADDFKLKVSADGSSWSDVFSVDRTTGQATFTMGTERTQVDVFTSSGTYSVPAWAKQVRAICIGGGGGGGSGASGTNASNRTGGAGGGGGGRAEALWLVSEIGASLTVTVAASASGGAAQSAANGAAGTAGNITSISDGANLILRALGGGAGGGGLATSASSAGAGGVGNGSGNAGGTGGSSGNLATATCGDGPGAGGGGGGITTAGVEGTGAAGCYGYTIGGGARAAAPGNGGAIETAGGAGSAKAWQRGCGGGGGGGGGGSASVSGGAGGAGGAPGGGGGGGGANRDTMASGAGGAGARGEVWFIAIG